MDKYGKTRVVEAQAGACALTLSGATANSNAGAPTDYVVDGNPVVLVESCNGDVATPLPLGVAPP